MKKDFTVSLCISTYNQPEWLELCLVSVLEQTRMPSEIIIGDDGSTQHTKAMIERMKTRFSIPVIHIWHPDEGFKLAQIRNKSFAAATGDYIIQVDGDVVMHRSFIEDHLKFARKEAFVAGTRSLLTEAATKQLMQEKNICNIPKLQLDKSYNAKRFLPASHFIYQVQKGLAQAKYVLGANMAFWKDDLMKINGYNEDYEGWGKEDNDLSIRLCNAGIILRFLKFAAIIYHLYHQEVSKDKMSSNEIMLMQAMKQKQTFTRNGMNKYL